ncbi:nucleoside hydrolase [Bradyrhizobium sp. WSM1253]|uniref:nucleoside hydrolase n=1 Tax=Bradyrhizobium sp. WSM1253 TaxID=319003 RepID=UPI00025D145D|nr:nucleoside hydrolase [Bradyrhizobium sp. WSM1253]EIG63864.1 Inosine-uridine nucleoside N-ribohydrolase [Bradyrhizobium sp. WSM1253]
MTKLVIDTDPGWDDALVLVLLLAKGDIDVLCVTTVWGNEEIADTTTNARRMTYCCGRPDIPIYVGCMQALKPVSIERPCPPSSIVRALPPLGTVVNGMYAPEMLTAMARTHGPELTILAIGSMTNMAAAVERDTAAMKSVGTVVVTGGTFTEKKTHEFNLGSDPLATNKLLEAELNPVMITFDLEMTMNKGDGAQQTMKDMKTKWASFYAEVIQDQLDQDNSEANEGVFDQLAALYALQPSLFTLEPTRIRVESGRIIRDPAGHPVRLATSLNIDAAYELLFKRLA